MYGASKAQNSPPTVLQRLVAIFMVAVALGVGANTVITPVYGNITGDSLPAWYVLDWCMALGALLALYLSGRDKWRLRSGAELKRHIDVNVLFYASLILFLWFFSSWFGSWGFNEMRYWSDLWWFINALFICVCLSVGRRLLCPAGDAQDSASAEGS